MSRAIEVDQAKALQEIRQNYNKACVTQQTLERGAQELREKIIVLKDTPSPTPEVKCQLQNLEDELVAISEIIAAFGVEMGHIESELAEYTRHQLGASDDLPFEL